MGKILTGLKELGSKMTGSEITSNRIGDAIREIASKYTGGGGGGVLIVHATVDEYYKTATLDKTFEEIAEYGPNVVIFVGGSSGEPFSEVYSLRTFGTLEVGGGLVGMFTFGRSYMDDNYVYYKEIEIAKMAPTADEEITATTYKDNRPYS